MSKTVEIEIEGLKALGKRFGDLTPDIAKKVKRAINLGAYAVERTAIKSIKSRSGGRRYRHKGKTHIASRPHKPPNARDGHLDKNIIVTTGQGIITKGYFALVRSRAKYSKSLEYGTKRMAPRPFMRKALQANIKSIVKNINDAKREALR